MKEEKSPGKGRGSSQDLLIEQVPHANQRSCKSGRNDDEIQKGKKGEPEPPPLTAECKKEQGDENARASPMAGKPSLPDFKKRERIFQKRGKVLIEDQISYPSPRHSSDENSKSDPLCRLFGRKGEILSLT